MTDMTTWRSVNEKLMTATEEEILEMLETEKKGPARLLFLLRIYGRYSKIREQRERDELQTAGVK